MAHYFRRDGDRIAVKLRPVEIELLRGLVGDVQRLIAEDVTPNDVTARLFPEPSFDPDVAKDLRGLIQDDLREAKRANARALLETLPDDGRVALDDDAAQAWLAALNDVRLALGTSIGVTEEEPEDDDDPGYVLYAWLTELQGTLVEALSAGGVGR